MYIFKEYVNSVHKVHLLFNNNMFIRIQHNMFTNIDMNAYNINMN